MRLKNYLESPGIIEVQSTKRTNKDRLIERYENEIFHLREERDEFKRLLFEKTGILITQQDKEKFKDLQPLGRTKLWSERKKELEKDHREKAREIEKNGAA